ncbi:hypothetical protein Tco_0213329 [Tanacetum coccineum]
MMLTSKSDFSTEPTLCSQHIDEFDLKDETSLSECDEEEQNVLYFNDLFPFNIIYPDDSKLDKDNDDHEINIKQSSRGNVINTDDGAYAHGSNNLLETSHDKSNNFFKAETFIKELNINIMTWNHLNKGMSLIFLIKNLLSIRRIQTPWIRRIDLLDVIQSLYFSTVDTACSLNEYSVFDTVIMEYLVKINEKARILELKRKYLKITVLTTNTLYSSRKIRRICDCTHQRPRRKQDPIRRIQKKAIRCIQVIWK